MKKLIICLFVLLFLSPFINAFDLKDNKIYSFHHTDKWDNIDKTFFTSFSTLMTIDCLQTRDLLSKNQKEKFHLEKYFNEDTVPLAFAGCILTSYFIADHLKSKPRKIFLTTLNIIDFRLVNHNKQIGLKLKINL